MTIIAVLSVFAGMLIGIRSKVLMTMPVIVTAVSVAATVTAMQGEAVWSVLAAATLSAIGVQIGYLCGSFVPFVKDVPETASAHVQQTSLQLTVHPRSVD